jgi:TRAP-type uncharacterized transport system fused permease subunit
MTVNDKAETRAEPIDLERLVADADLGGRTPGGTAARLLTVVAICWSLFQLWYASPLPFMLNFGILNDTTARGLHLCFAFTLAFLAFPAFASSPRDRVPWTDWLIAICAVASVLYLIVFYKQLAQRPGLPTGLDVAVSVAGVLLLIEASRRVEGPWMPVISIVALAYVFLGPWLPGMRPCRVQPRISG